MSGGMLLTLGFCFLQNAGADSCQPDRPHLDVPVRPPVLCSMLYAARWSRSTVPDVQAPPLRLAESND